MDAEIAPALDGSGTTVTAPPAAAPALVRDAAALPGVSRRPWWLPIVAFDLVPLVGVLALGWDVGQLLVLFWVGNGLVGLANVVQTAAARGPIAPTRAMADTLRFPRVSGTAEAPSLAARLATAWSFAVNYGMFWLVHGFFVLLIASGVFFTPGDLPRNPADWVPDLPLSFWVTVAGLAVLHALDVAAWFRAGEYLRISTVAQSNAPYGRMIVLHIGIVLGAVFVLAVGEPFALLVVLVAAKLGIDLLLEWHHLRGARGTGLTDPPACAADAPAQTNVPAVSLVRC